MNAVEIEHAGFTLEQAAECIGISGASLRIWLLSRTRLIPL